jgi:hypothetical protein
MLIRPSLPSPHPTPSCLSTQPQSSVVAHPSTPSSSPRSPGCRAVSFPCCRQRRAPSPPASLTCVVATRVAQCGCSSVHPLPQRACGLPHRALPPIAGHAARPRSICRSPALQSPASLAPSPFVRRLSLLGAPLTLPWPLGHMCRDALGLPRSSQGALTSVASASSARPPWLAAGSHPNG